jgi:NAD(P)-dependent dehydrogenase (short-subunit alcohol dehydrogenase family)
MAVIEGKEKWFPPQHQNRVPGIEQDMMLEPLEKGEWYRGSGKLKDKVALITGGDSGIGRSVAIFYAREGADVAIVYYDEHADAARSKQLVEQEGRRCITIAGDVGESLFCRKAITETVRTFGKLDILVNNAALMPYQDNLDTLSDRQLEATFRTNIFSYFFMAREALHYLKEGSVIINTASITAYRGSSHLLDYSSTKGAIVAFTRSLALMLAKKGMRVNGVAPGPIWTPLIPSSLPADQVRSFGHNTTMHRAGHPEEVAPAYVFLAARDSSYMTGQILHPNGGEIINT